MKHLQIKALLLISTAIVGAAAHADDWKPIPRVLPPVGMKLPEAQQQEIQSAEKALAARIAPVTADPDGLLPDIELYDKAIRFALVNGEFYSAKDVPVATALIATANKRLDELAQNQHPWTTQHGQFVRGYRSVIDDSVQPYGLEIPADLDLSKPVPLYVWLHGRGDSDTDLHFIRGREGHKGQIQPAGAIVLHAFGRQCLGFKSAGETDVFEAINSVENRYKIDPDRVVLMGFSMGGAGAWHLGAHYADQFCAVHAGAGFVDVAKYQKIKPDDYPVWYEQKLWGVYDVPDYTRNLFNTTMVAYGGEIDPQRASSEIMAEEFKKEGHELVRLVGPKMPHKYDPASLAEIMRRMNDAVQKGRDRFPKKLSLQTRTLRYNHMFWAELTGLGEHWLDSRLDAEVPDDSHIVVTTKNAERLKLSSPWPFRQAQGGPFPQAQGGPGADGPDRQIEVRIDGSPVMVALSALRSGKAEFIKTPAGWDHLAAADSPEVLRKRHGLQGPIDDAFMEGFLVVTPSGSASSPAVQKWVDFELAHFQSRWREVFRGELRMKKDTEVTPDDIAKYHLVLWGDAKSNRLIAQTLGKLPLVWTDKELSVGGKKFDVAKDVPLMIYPNPLNPAKYVVLNSGPTFREASDHTNSLQNPKLPDWAVIEITHQPTAKAAGEVEDAGFFDEHWQVKGK
ncbi:MAG TPA: alpha/beta hydrolase-fold protein [Tepidisphaeraceae bacterium]|jgi:pimeloyl-ACP methyl ester carboxylesterase|nr:alpha/beta hydrolase-fold protein [Tepidisphaeraceae bacterium]